MNPFKLLITIPRRRRLIRESRAIKAECDRLYDECIEAVAYRQMEKAKRLQKEYRSQAAAHSRIVD